jgi:HK97 family phage prohead protease
VLYTQPILLTRFAPGADSDADIGVFEGVASTPGRDRHGDVVAKGAFGTSIEELESGKRRVPLLVDHDPRSQIGGIKSAREDDAGLQVKGQIVRGTPAADRAYALSKAGEMGLSIGFMPMPEASEKLPGGGTLYKSVDLVEISAVSTPSNRGSRILRIKELAQSSPREVEEILREAFPDIPGRLAKKMAVACLDVLNDSDDDRPNPAELAAVQAALAGALKIFKSR